MSTLYKQIYGISKFDKRQQKTSDFKVFEVLIIFMNSKNRITPSELSFGKRQNILKGKKIPCTKLIIHGNLLL